MTASTLGDATQLHLGQKERCLSRPLLINVAALQIHASVPRLGIDHDFGKPIVAHRARPIIDSFEDVFMHEIAHVSNLVEAARLDRRGSDQSIADFKRVLFLAN